MGLKESIKTAYGIWTEVREGENTQPLIISAESINDYTRNTKG